MCVCNVLKMFKKHTMKSHYHVWCWKVYAHTQMWILFSFTYSSIPGLTALNEQNMLCGWLNLVMCGWLGWVIRVYRNTTHTAATIWTAVCVTMRSLKSTAKLFFIYCVSQDKLVVTNVFPWMISEMFADIFKSLNQFWFLHSAIFW